MTIDRVGEAYNGSIRGAENVAPDLLIPRAGKRRLIGWALNTGYGRPDADLRGCLNDALHIDQYVMGYGYDETRWLLDGEATKENIRELQRWAISVTGPDDVLGNAVASHGALGKDGHAMLVCAGALTAPSFAAACIRGAEVREFFAALPPGAKTWCWYDLCHAGGARAFNHVYSVPRFLPHPVETAALQAQSLAAELYQAALGAFYHFARKHEQGRILEAPTMDVFLPACRVDQVAADAFIDGDYCGAMSTMLLKADPMNPAGSVRAAMAEAVRLLAAGGYAQVPIPAGEELDGPLP